MKLVELIKDTLLEFERLNKITKTLKITYDLQMTKHAIERKLRHLDTSDTVITDKSIIDLIDKSIPVLTTSLIQDKININDEVLLTDRATNLNVIGIIQLNKSNNEIQFIIKTIMIKKNFYPKSNTFQFFI